MLREAANRRTDKARNDVVRELSDHHRGVEQLGTELGQVGDRLDLADELVDVLAPAELRQDAHGLDDPVAAPLRLDHELVLGQVDAAFVQPVIERRLGEEDPISHYALSP